MKYSEKPKKILIITLSNLGDVVLTIPVISVLRELFKEAELSILVGSRPRELFKGHPSIHKTYVYDKTAPFVRKFSLIVELRREQFDLVIDLRHSILPILIGARKSSPLIRPTKSRSHAHAVEKHLSLLRTMGFPAVEPYTTFPLFTESDVENVRDIFRLVGLDFSKPFIVFAPGARSHLKRWPAFQFKALAEALFVRYRMPIILVGDRDEAPICAEVVNGLEDCVFNFCGKTSVGELSAILGSAQLVVTNDSASLHIADRQNRHIVALFGPTDERKYGPRNPKGCVVRRNLFCSPCGLAQCPYKHECMQDLSLGAVREACTALLGEYKLSEVSL